MPRRTYLDLEWKMICRLFALTIVLVAGGISPLAFCADLPFIPIDMNERVIKIPVGSGWNSFELETTLFAPPGSGPFPLVVINHGKASGNPRFDPRARYPIASREFLRRGYVVALPMRRGFANSTGAYIDGGCNIESNSDIQAEDVINVLRELVNRPEIDASRIVIVGQSHGGLTTVAVGSIGYPGVRGLLNFAGGLKRTDCMWEKPLTDAFASYGKTTRIPSLWFYGDNDSYWGAELPKAMYRAYTATGAPAKLVSYGVYADGDAHSMFGRASGVPIWLPPTETFLSEIGMPTAIKFEVEAVVVPPKSNFAALDDVAAIPYIKSACKANYSKFLSSKPPRAFSIAENGACGYSTQDDATWISVMNCSPYAKGTKCKPYAIDDDVVWTENR